MTEPVPSQASEEGTSPLASPEPSPSEATAAIMRRLFYFALAALAFRLFVLRFPAMFTLDVNTFRSWTDTLLKVGPNQFYTSTWSDYPPVFMYFLWIWGWLQYPFTHSTLISVEWEKLPACLADVVNGYLIFHLLKGRIAIRSASRAAVIYWFNPVVWFVSAVWGQVDSIITLMMLLVSMAVLANQAVRAGLLAALAVLVKPQGLFIIPAAFFGLMFRTPLKRWPLAIAAGLASVWVALLPVTYTKLGGFPAFLIAPYFWLANLMSQTGNNYPYSTVNAFNIWLLPPPNESWKSDAQLLFFLPHRVWGIVLIAGALAAIGVYVWRNRARFGAPVYFLAASATLTSFYMLPTRMHERYIFPAIAFLALAAACNRRLNWIYAGFSLTSLVSIGYIFFFYNDKSAWVEGLKALMGNGPMLGNLKLSGMVVLSLVNVWLFGELMGAMFSKRQSEPLTENRLWAQLKRLPTALPVHALARADVLIPAGIAAVFFLVGIVRLGVPTEQIFDEVYHARTAMEYLAGVSPYEWTHPPLAKLILASGVWLLHGQWDLAAKTFTEAQTFSWRFTSLLFGALTLPIFYALSRSMTDNRKVATAATAMLALDGVFFVQSRVAMTNIYEVCFILLGVLGLWCYVKTSERKMLFLAGFGLGLAIATRWSSLYAWGLSGLVLLVRYALLYLRAAWIVEPPSVKARLKSLWRALVEPASLKEIGLTLLAMIALPAALYLLTYIPNVLQGSGDWLFKLVRWDPLYQSGWSKVIALQGDMWRYHATLNATHPYAAPWWSWPLMLRPTWYYFHDWHNGSLSGVWAMGNAFVWWASMPALAFVGYKGWLEKKPAFLLVALFGYGLWVMWGVQPRPLLYMHYMFESIPFACLALSLIGAWLWKDPEPDAPAEPAPVPALSRTARRGVVVTYAALVAGWFVFYYPLLSALPIPWWFYQLHVWFGRAWI